MPDAPLTSALYEPTVIGGSGELFALICEGQMQEMISYKCLLGTAHETGLLSRLNMHKPSLYPH